MANFRRTGLILGCCCVLGAVTAGCGNQSSSNPPPADSAKANAPAANAPPEPQQGATVSELLSGSNVPPAPAQDQGAAPAQGEDAPASANSGAGDVSRPADDDGGGATADANDVEYAQVVSIERIQGPQQICTDHTVVVRRKPEDEHRVAGTVIGALAGGLIGSKVGRGSGRTAATVGGAVAGGAIGREVQREHQDRDTERRVVRRCRPVKADERGATLYDVVYAYNGQTFHVKLDHDPGDRIALPVRGVE
jgi:uncharacterized protein YcfJ